MAIRILLDGTIEVDTATEMVAYEQALQAGRLTQLQRTLAVRRTPETSIDGAWDTFHSALVGRNDFRAIRMKTVLGLVRNNGQEGISWKDLSDALGDTNLSKTSGTVSGMAKSARSSGLNPKDVLVVGKDKRVRPGPLLQRNEPPRSYPEKKAH